MKKVIFLFFAIVASLVLSSCDKKTNEVMLDMGYIQCTNISSDPYLVEIAGPTTTTLSVLGNGVKTISVSTGYYNINVTQQSGYLIYPTKQSYSGAVTTGKTLVVAFPQ